MLTRLLTLLVLGWGVTLGIVTFKQNIPPLQPAEPAGNTTISMLADLMHQQLRFPSGWLPNDVITGRWLDNAANEQLGMLSVMRPLLKAIRDQASRSPTALNREIDLAYSSWTADPRRWKSPASEILYARGIQALRRYQSMLNNDQAQFQITPRSLTAVLQALSRSLTGQLSLLSNSQIPTFKKDDYFYQARGTALATSILLQSLIADFQPLLTTDSVQQRSVLPLLQQTQHALQQADFRPLIITYGIGSSLTANHIQRIQTPLQQALEHLTKALLELNQ